MLNEVPSEEFLSEKTTHITMYLWYSTIDFGH